VTLSSESPDFRAGSGPEADRGVNGLAFAGERLVWNSPRTGNVFSVDVATGARTLVSSGVSGMTAGEGASPRLTFLAAIDERTVWISGRGGFPDMGGYLAVAIDLETGNRTAYEWDTDGPLGVRVREPGFVEGAAPRRRSDRKRRHRPARQRDRPRRARHRKPLPPLPLTAPNAQPELALPARETRAVSRCSLPAGRATIAQEPDPGRD
jgi:hypothetical protein